MASCEGNEAVFGEVEGVDLDLRLLPGAHKTDIAVWHHRLHSSRQLSAGTIIITCWAGVTTPPIEWTANGAIATMLTGLPKETLDLFREIWAAAAQVETLSISSRS